MYLIKLGQSFDYSSQYVIDINMCTDVCPCRTNITQSQIDKNQVASSNINDPQYIYSKVTESYLLIHNRTWQKIQNENIRSFKWSSDPKFSFLNFQDCLVHWIQQSYTNKSVDLNKLFKVGSSKSIQSVFDNSFTLKLED